MIKFLKRSEIDIKKWDQLIAAAHNGMPYGYSWYLDTVTDAWGGLIKDDYTAVFPLAYRRKFGIQYCYQPFFTQYFSVYSREMVSSVLEARFLESIPQTFKMLEFNIAFDHTDITAKGINLTKRSTYHLDLTKSYDEIASGFGNNLRRNLKKSRSALLQVIKNVQPEMLTEMFISTVGRGLKELSSQDYYALQKLMKLTVQKGMGEVTGVYNQKNELLAVGFFIHSHSKTINLFPAANKMGKDAGAMHFLLDYLIRTHAGSGRILDFEGSEIPSIARFYKSFGARHIPYWRVFKNNLPWGLNKAFYLYKKLK